MNARTRKILGLIFAKPTRTSLRWSDIDAMLRALGVTVSEGRGSRVRVELNGQDAVFHRSHPKPDTDKGAVEAVRQFLMAAGIRP